MEQTQAQGMLCPHCHVDLVMSERQHVEIDYCPKCRGIWLDRGELDTIIERAVAEARAAPVAPVPVLPSAAGAQGVWPSHTVRESASYESPHGYRKDDDDRRHDDRDAGSRSRESFFERLFD
jgi:uncharacterized protein